VESSLQEGLALASRFSLFRTMINGPKRPTVSQFPAKFCYPPARFICEADSPPVVRGRCSSLLSVGLPRVLALCSEGLRFLAPFGQLGLPSVQAPSLRWCLSCALRDLCGATPLSNNVVFSPLASLARYFSFFCDAEASFSPTTFCLLFFVSVLEQRVNGWLFAISFSASVFF